MKSRIKNFLLSPAGLVALAILVLLLGVGVFASNNAVETSNYSPEVAYLAYSPTGPGGGAVIPASCESGFEHSPGECAPPPPPPPTASISANPTTIPYNTASTISWSSTNATSCTVSPTGWTGTSGSQGTGNLTSSQTYTVNCSGPGGSAPPVSATVNVLPGDFNLSLGGSVACNSVPLTWTVSSGATAYRILRGSPRVDISPYQPYTALNFTDTTVSQNTSYIYQIEAYNSGGTNRSNALNVTTPFCPPTLSFSGSPTSIFQGQSSTLTWSSANTTSCTASGSWSGSKALNGSEIVFPSPPPSATYNLTCSGPGGSVSGSATINITPLALPDWREIIPR